MTPTPKSASGAVARQTMEQAKPQGAAGPFVLNLCSSTTPMALSNPEQPELKRFSFFVSRRFEEGRERFRLHMGYFQTLKEAEEWLGAVRDIYPGAWAGEAPGKKLRERAVAAAAAQAQHAAGPPPRVTSSSIAKEPAVASAPRDVPTLAVAQSTPVEVPALNVPTIHAATPNSGAPAAPPRNVPAAKPAPTAAQPAGAAAPRVPVVVAGKGPSTAAASASAAGAPKAVPAAPVVSAPRADSPRPVDLATPLKAVPLPVAPTLGRPVPAAAAARNTPAPAAKVAQPVKVPGLAAAVRHASAQATAPRAAGGSTSRPSSKAAAKSSLPNSNVREVLKALDETPAETEVTGETRMMPAPMMAALDSASDTNSFTDTQVLRYLETRRADGSEITGVDVESGAISLLKPDDTGTRRALKEAVADNAPVWFAVQLQWSVQPVELSKVPPLAIFSAYTLYTVEGSRDGRKWYGLRLGFFSDAISAKQVAYYVRSEFNSVAVVPVSPQERSRASDVDKKAHLSFPKKPRSEPVDEFKLIDSEDAPAVVQSRPATPAAKPAAPAKAAPPPSAAAARRAPNKASSRVRAREHRAPQTLEETLEILGAGELEMDNGSGETLNESGVRHLRVEVQKNTPFGRLLERLSERVRKP
jgi:hypothetical protein